MISEEFDGEVAVLSKVGKGSVFFASMILPETTEEKSPGIESSHILNQEDHQQKWLEDRLSDIRQEQLRVVS